jgi:aspartate/methionine/tyrosine aminotransferase
MASKNTINESVIRKMTRLAIAHKAVNLSQGIPNESPPKILRLALAYSALSGQPPQDFTFSEDISESDIKNSLISLLTENGKASLFGDQLNQYSQPCGREDLRKAISGYYNRFYNYDISPDDITVTLGATEAFASALRTVGRPGDKCVIIEPFHELYPSQCKIFYLDPVYVSLTVSDNRWVLDFDKLEEALRHSKILLFNSPHNPSGKVFTREELKRVVDLCLKHDVYLITDEIYEHMCFGNNSHFLIPKEFPKIIDRTLVCNSLGKSASATGWRLGWCLHPPHLRDTYRGIHDQMTVMSPHPIQYATLAYFSLSDTYFEGLASRYQKKVEKLEIALKAAGFGVVTPQGAYYLFVDYTKVKCLNDLSCMDAAMYLLKSLGIACVPGENFYGSVADRNQGGNYLRFAACRSDTDLEDAVFRLKGLQ